MIKMLKNLKIFLGELADMNEGQTEIALKNRFSFLILQALLTLSYYFGIIWMAYFHKEENNIFIYLGCVIVGGCSLINLREKKMQKCKPIPQKLLQIISIVGNNLLFILTARLLLNPSQMNVDNNLEEIFTLLLRYIIAISFQSAGYLRWEIIILQILTSGGLVHFLIMISIEKSDSVTFSYILRILQLFFLLFSTILVLLNYQSRKGESLKLDLLQKVIRKTELGVCILKGKEIVYSNEALLNILRKKSEISDRNRLCFKDFENLALNRYLRVRELPQSIISTKRNSKQFTNSNYCNTLNFEECLEILKRAPENELKFYTTFISETPFQPNNSCLLTSQENEDNRIFANIQLDSVIENGAGETSLAECRQYEVSFSHIDWEKQKADYILIKFSDFTEAQIFMEGEKRKEFKQNMLNCFSHELKTPLNISANMIKMLTDDEAAPEEKRKKCLSVAQISLEKLSYLIFDIVDFLKLESEELFCEVSKFKIAQVLNEVLALVAEYGEEKGVRIKTKENLSREYQVQTDRHRLKRILLNVLMFLVRTNENVDLIIDFSKVTEEDIELIIMKEKLGSCVNNRSIDLESTPRSKNYKFFFDFGLYISKIFLKNLLNFGVKRFSLNEASEEGMVFSARFALTEDMIYSDYGVSAKLSVPLEIEDEILAPSKKNKEFVLAPNFLKRKQEKISRSCIQPKGCPRTLIVDDDVFNIISLEMILERLNIKSIKAYNGLEALQLLKEYTCSHACENENCRGIEFIIMDLMMPVMNGFEATSILLQMMAAGEISTVPIYACSANDSKEIYEHCREIGFSDFLNKPINFISLHNLLKSFSS